MAKVKPGLGRGLDALLKPRPDDQDGQDEVKEKRTDESQDFRKINVDNISPNPFQPRSNFDKEALEELKKSILVNGLIQPITVRKKSKDNYELISGERRLRACKEIGYDTIPAYVMDVVSDELMLAMALIENIQRERLNPVEVGLAYKKLMDECGLTQEEIAERVGKDRTTIANSIRLLKLPGEIQQSLLNDEISMGHARALININDKKMQIALLKKITRDNLSVRNVEQLVKDELTNKKSGSKKHSASKTSSGNKDTSVKALEDSLRRTFGTKVLVKQKKDGGGEINIEFYSNDELDRLLELFNIIDTHG